ncbi:DNA-binding transcriptional regulator, LysR family [Aureimonas altamirensis DSM 21988]|uniref:DNA-binding transcriptional regulator, LysR family n=1 Tax=Aureimonas altamirensis DSM 21988 TaxID=1121026 RepID=A0ABY1IJH1_9HYPH|nr:LysR substrate-binding domain-containing protein [Aureimonas altamirensis]SHJ26423.1 DNA-binding transcriptional regulator, LysR family [Aureimonas altamirensis DSM 21988]
MDTRFLETFLFVACHGSMAEASRRLNITPAAAAQRIQALEAEIGQPLLMRVGRTVRPTPAGLAILSQSRRILGDVRQLRNLATGDRAAGELRVGAISTALTGLLPRPLRALRTAMPEIEFFVLPGTSSELYQKLDDDQIDVALIVRPPFELPKTLEWHMVRSEPLVLLTPSAWQEQSVESLLSSRPFIRYDRNNWGGRLSEEYLLATSIQPREWVELDSLEAISVLVSSELGISIVPDWARPWPEGISVTRLPLPSPARPREIGLLWPRASPALRMIAVLAERMASPPRE